MNGKELLISLRNGNYVYGTAILSPSPIWPKVVATLGLDFVFIDTEHTPIDRAQISNMCQIYKALNIAPIVRIPSPDPYQASMVIDGGATGIIAPYIESAEQIRQLVGAVKNKPLKGKKLQQLLLNEIKEENALTKYLKHHNEENVLIANIESTPAIENLDDILSVKGLDAISIGPHDLTCSLGIPEQYDNPLFIKTVDTIIEKAKYKKIGVGIHMFYKSGFNQEIIWAQKGANFIIHSSDILAFKETISTELALLKMQLNKVKSI